MSATCTDPTCTRVVIPPAQHAEYVALIAHAKRIQPQAEAGSPAATSDLTWLQGQIADLAALWKCDGQHDTPEDTINDRPPILPPPSRADALQMDPSSPRLGNARANQLARGALALAEHAAEHDDQVSATLSLTAATLAAAAAGAT